MVVDTFEAREGWVPASPEGSVWCYRTRGNAGVLAFKRTDGGERVYEATHQDCYASDATITTTRWLEAVRFAVAGAPPAVADDDRASEGEGGAPPATAEGRAGASAPARDLDRAALRAAWQQHLAASAPFLRQLEQHLDARAPEHGELLAAIGRALELLHGDTTSPETARRAHAALCDALGASSSIAAELLSEALPSPLAEHPG